MLALVGVLFAPTGALASAEDVREALAALDIAVKETQNGNYEAARRATAHIARTVATQQQSVSGFYDSSVKALKQCERVVSSLDARIGAVTSEQERALQDLLNAVRNQDLSYLQEDIAAQQIESIDAALVATRAKAQARIAQLNKVKRWWWVPGYGAYLGIKSLAEQDSQALRSLERTRDELRKSRERETSAQAAAQEEIKRYASAYGKLIEVRFRLRLRSDELEARMKRVRNTTALTATANQFWADLAAFTQYQVRGAAGSTVAMATALEDRLEQTVNEAVLIGIGTEHGNLREQLVQLASSLDNANGNGAAALADGQCALDEATSSPEPSQCHIATSWPYYEIVDVAKCEVRYLNPSACPPVISPPPPAPAETDDKDLLAKEAELKQSTVGLQAPEQNWVGVSRCTSKNALYLGKAVSAAACAVACQERRDCLFWTFNVNSNMIEGTAGECWGGKRDLVPHIAAWPGFVSGGAPCKQRRKRDAKGRYVDGCEQAKPSTRT